MGLSYIGRSCLQTIFVSGKRRVPAPPARRMAFFIFDFRCLIFDRRSSSVKATATIAARILRFRSNGNRWFYPAQMSHSVRRAVSDALDDHQHTLTTLLQSRFVVILVAAQ